MSERLAGTTHALDQRLTNTSVALGSLDAAYKTDKAAKAAKEAAKASQKVGAFFKGKKPAGSG